MECAQVAEAVQKYHEGEASLKDDPEVFAHLKGCAACRESLQKVLYDVDLAAYSAFFEEIDPPEDFADQVIDAIPGGEEKTEGRRPERGGARKKAGSSGKLAVVRGERKPLGRALRASASAGLKPAHHTTTVRRREEPSGVFLTDQIFGSQEKKRGLIITYCEECGERIDPADFDTGAAIQHQNASYCRKCKSKVVPEELEPEGASREKAEPKAKRPARAEASPRAAASRGAPAPRAAQPVNYMKVGGIFMGVALLLVVGVVVVLSTGGDDGAPPPRERAAGAKAKREDAAGGGQGGAEAKKAEAANKGGNELDKLMAVE
ncbi:MAG: zf-HC2 domain-containing protein, partial [Planctomycetes bacterium]|nr:zf-HC2 domain-containing protein [Planctomycetota bacterium]